MTEKNNDDLISREALKKALKSNCDLCHDKNTNWCENCCPHNDFEDLIDNAPTVNFIISPDEDYGYAECPYCHEMRDRNRHAVHDNSVIPVQGIFHGNAHYIIGTKNKGIERQSTYHYQANKNQQRQ